MAETEIPGGGGRGRLYLPLHCHHQSDSALRSAITRAVLKLSLTEGELHKTECTDHTFRRERTAEAESNRSSSPYKSNALPLGQTGSWPGDRQTRLFTNEIQTHKSFQRTLFITTRQSQQIFRVIPLCYNASSHSCFGFLFTNDRTQAASVSSEQKNYKA